MAELPSTRVVGAYLRAFEHIVQAGFIQDVNWARALASVRPDRGYVVSEAAWGIVNSGFRYQVARRMWPSLLKAASGFDVSKMLKSRQETKRCMLAVLNYPRKIDAILAIAELSEGEGWKQIVQDAKEPTKLQRLPFIGPTTCFHLAKSLGTDCVKPDVHLRRAAAAAGYETPLALCEAIRCEADVRRSRLVLVDIVLWRYGEQQASRGWPPWEELFRER